MILKYKVPENQRFRYNNKEIIYCEVKRKFDLKTCNRHIYLVTMINNERLTTIFSSKELKRLNILDRIKLWKMKK